MTYFIDASYLLALLISTDQLHRRAAGWQRKLRRQSLLTTEFVLIETCDGAGSPHRRQYAAALWHAMEHDHRMTIVPASSELLHRGLRLYESRPDKSWSLTDCTSFEVMRDHGLTLALTYDHHFEQAGFDPLLRRDPVA